MCGSVFHVFDFREEKSEPHKTARQTFATPIFRSTVRCRNQSLSFELSFSLISITESVLIIVAETVNIEKNQTPQVIIAPMIHTSTKSRKYESVKEITSPNTKIIEKTNERAATAIADIIGSFL